MIGKIGFLKSAIAICLCAGASLEAAELRGTEIGEPEALARITAANYCFAHSRALEVERVPPSYLVLDLKIQVVYHNSGTRPMILPLGRELAVYTSLHPGAMKVSPQPSRSFEDSYVTEMKVLPANVDPQNPVNPANDVFRIIPAGKTAEFPLEEEVALPVNHKALFRHDPDLRGHRVYIRLQFEHRELDPALEAELSDRWVSFGGLWTGMLRTNTMTFDVPASPASAAPCIDTRVPVPFDGHLQTTNNK
jgi:hypothetical protein